MFQDFSSPAANSGDPTRIAALRRRLAENGLAGFLIPRADEHQGEYVPPHAERLSWLTGFTGSAGMAAILIEKAALFVDGRYTLQAPQQVATEIITPLHSNENPIGAWLIESLSDGDVIGFDPWLHTMAEVKQLSAKLAPAGIGLQPVDNLVDQIWTDQPAPPNGPVEDHPITFAGKTSAEKIKEAQTTLREQGVEAFLCTQPDSICWLLNIRGRDVPHMPLVLTFALLKNDGDPVLFLDESRIPHELLGSLEATCAPRSAMFDHLNAIKGTIGLDAATTPEIVKTNLEAADLPFKEIQDPCLLPKATKNDTEQAGTRAAHIRDGVAITRFLSWLDSEPIANLTEIEAAKKLEAFRRDVGAEQAMPLQDISFDTISGFGANGAIVHYRVTEETDEAFRTDTLFLLDSGGQYQDGTTDITRTIAIGTPSDPMRRHFTLVLKGMIAVSLARFPKGASGAQLDTLARIALWQAGLDFDHGTGHGVGSFLSVHEGPQRISKVSSVPLQPGMILSNEPGYYETDAYGIRIENLVLVKAPEAIEGGNREMMGFETLTFAPIDRRLVDASLLSAVEREWLNAYHAEVFEKLSPHLNDTDSAWLKAATAPLNG